MAKPELTTAHNVVLKAAIDNYVNSMKRSTAAKNTIPGLLPLYEQQIRTAEEARKILGLL